MKTHEFAKQLSLMAKILRAGPNVELEEYWMQKPTLASRSQLEEKDIPLALNALVGLNEVKKEQWVSLIEEYGYTIDVRPRDANRDIVGKLINYLANNPDAREKLSGRQSKRKTGTSAELADALNLLLK